MTYSVVGGQLNPGTVVISTPKKSSSPKKSSGSGGGGSYVAPAKPAPKPTPKPTTPKVQLVGEPYMIVDGKKVPQSQVTPAQQAKAIESLSGVSTTKQMKTQGVAKAYYSQPSATITSTATTTKKTGTKLPYGPVTKEQSETVMVYPPTGPIFTMKPEKGFSSEAARGIAFANQAKSTGELIYKGKLLEAQKQEAITSGSQAKIAAYNTASVAYNAQLTKNFVSGKKLALKEQVHIEQANLVSQAKAWKTYESKEGVGAAAKEFVKPGDIGYQITKDGALMIPTKAVASLPTAFDITAQQALVSGKQALGIPISTSYYRKEGSAKGTFTTQPPSYSPIPSFTAKGNATVAPEITPRMTAISELQQAALVGQIAGTIATPFVAKYIDNKLLQLKSSDLKLAQKVKTKTAGGTENIAGHDVKMEAGVYGRKTYIDLETTKSIRGTQKISHGPGVEIGPLKDVKIDLGDKVTAGASQAAGKKGLVTAYDIGIGDKYRIGVYKAQPPTGSPQYGLVAQKLVATDATKGSLYYTRTAGLSKDYLLGIKGQTLTLSPPKISSAGGAAGTSTITTTKFDIYTPTSASGTTTAAAKTLYVPPTTSATSQGISSTTTKTTPITKTSSALVMAPTSQTQMAAAIAKPAAASLTKTSTSSSIMSMPSMSTSISTKLGSVQSTKTSSTTITIPQTTIDTKTSMSTAVMPATSVNIRPATTSLTTPTSISTTIPTTTTVPVSTTTTIPQTALTTKTATSIINPVSPITPSTLVPVTPPPPPPPPPVILFGVPDLGAGGLGFKPRKATKSRKFKKRYAASPSAQFIGKTTKRKPRRSWTGLEIRPILIR